jgi:hypothetical protein
MTQAAVRTPMPQKLPILVLKMKAENYEFFCTKLAVFDFAQTLACYTGNSISNCDKDASIVISIVARADVA